jgi:hypothetical protein
MESSLIEGQIESNKRRKTLQNRVPEMRDVELTRSSSPSDTQCRRALEEGRTGPYRTAGRECYLRDSRIPLGGREREGGSKRNGRR